MKELINIARINVSMFCLMSLIMPLESNTYKKANHMFNGFSADNRIQTIYSHKGTPIMQFKYKNEGQSYCTDCSVPDWANMVDFTNTLKRHETIFAPACHQHDLNYRAPWRIAGYKGCEGKKISDNKFYQDMVQICLDTHDNVVEEIYCKSVALLWYNSVKYFGDKSFEKGQDVAGEDCDLASISSFVNTSA